ncbi:dipeptidase PepV [Bacillus cereus group sp. Bc002]|uniref:dipeptidase PepV n=1 Tax=Bacillus cereus group TaxID=86661 RepID=UPI0009379A47|nr:MULTISPECIES: dipeptidase PepV [Bacillus cereus group]ASI80001.1 dipeptidase PepV [Bacillus cereus]MCC2483469.1 dipeptidase PepV [Bacillus pacificus]MDA1607345.1 dipeptidase PepV [Bacillus cereus group sp. TH208-1LC]MDA1663436.1 dipeptidase PepV [Bacillus cereus group sp. TH153LC]MDA2141013.1 dipeptidase PepV [Bacillus cereus group sp. Bc256]
MSAINWTEEVAKRKDDLIRDTQQFLQIKSVWEEESAKEGAPFGEGVEKALSFMLHKGETEGFTSKNLEGYAGHLEMGQGEELVGILCHVDVVPEGDGWTTPAYSADIRDGKIFARGAIDDKGPTMAAYYAMKIVKELGLPLSKRVRMILGTDEESNWKCVDHYFKNEEMPTIGFAPDADFPIINAEKGISDIQVVQNGSEEKKGTYELVSFESGRRLNMVPDFAEAVVTGEDVSALTVAYEEYLQTAKKIGEAIVEGNTVTLQIKGVSAHGSTPEKGENAGLLLANFLTKVALDGKGASFATFAAETFIGDIYGEKATIAYKDEVSGPLTVNVGRLSYAKENGGNLGLNVRYPVTTNFEETIAKLKEYVGTHGFEVADYSNSRPHHVDKDHVLIRTLQRVYEEQTGEKAELLAIGGGTYARSLKAGVAFGPLFPGKEELAHQKDEYIEIEDLLKATAIYAQAIYELAK